jgi:hypothetical protein
LPAQVTEPWRSFQLLPLGSTNNHTLTLPPPPPLPPDTTVSYVWFASQRRAYRWHQKSRGPGVGSYRSRPTGGEETKEWRLVFGFVHGLVPTCHASWPPAALCYPAPALVTSAHRRRGHLQQAPTNLPLQPAAAATTTAGTFLHASLHNNTLPPSGHQVCLTTLPTPPLLPRPLAALGEPATQTCRANPTRQQPLPAPQTPRRTTTPASSPPAGATSTRAKPCHHKAAQQVGTQRQPPNAPLCHGYLPPPQAHCHTLFCHHGCPTTNHSRWPRTPPLQPATLSCHATATTPCHATLSTTALPPLLALHYSCFPAANPGCQRSNPALPQRAPPLLPTERQLLLPTHNQQLATHLTPLDTTPASELQSVAACVTSSCGEPGCLLTMGDSK